MRIHHLDCASMCPVGGRLYDGCSHGVLGRLVSHCLLIETANGLVLVDTGIGLQDVLDPYPRLSALYVNLLNVQLDPARTAVRQIRRLGYDPRDVRHIVLTHLDFDHAGGLEDFPEAEVHVMRRELGAARHPDGFVAQRRYRPRQWDDVRRWRLYDSPTGGERWFGFRAVRELAGLPPEILMVPLPGHTWGHAGIAVDTGRGWLLNAGDAYFYRGEMGSTERRCTPGLRFYQTLMEVDRRLRFHNQQRLRELSLDPRANVTIFCGHDAVEFDALRAGRPIPRTESPRAAARERAVQTAPVATTATAARAAPRSTSPTHPRRSRMAEPAMRPVPRGNAGTEPAPAPG